MRLRNIAGSLLVLGGVGLAPTQGAITFLHHFDDAASFDVKPANGDHAAGDATATVSVTSPGHDAGYFTAAANNRSFRLTGTQSITFDAPSNVQTTGSTTGGFTVGFWFKAAATDLKPIGQLVSIEQISGDFARIEYGGSKNKAKIEFRNDDANNVYATAQSTASAPDSNWIYIAATVDFSANAVTMYTYTGAGVLVNTPVSAAFTSANSWTANTAGGVIRVGGAKGATTTDLWIDELSIDNTVLTQTEIKARVDSMIAGNSLSVPEPTTIAPAGMLLAGLLSARRRRQSRSA